MSKFKFNDNGVSKTVPTVTGEGATGSWSINSSTATALETARTINGVSFNGTSNITITASPPIGSIVDADISPSAGIVDTKLATISTAGKVSNSATTATSANTSNAIVSRDPSGNFLASQLTIYNAILTNNSSALTGTDFSLQFAAVLSDGNYINLGGTGRNIGVKNSGASFSTFGINWDSTVNSYVYSNSLQPATAIEQSFAGIFFNYAPSGTAGNSVTPTTGMLMETNGNVTITNLTASQLVATNGSKVLISLAYDAANTASAVMQRDANGDFSSSTANLTKVSLSQTPSSTLFPIAFSSGAGGTFLSWAGSRSGIVSGGDVFSSRNLAYDTTNGFTFIAGSGTGAGFITRMSNSAFQFQYATGGTAGAPATLTTGMSISNNGNVNINNLTASQAVVTDASKNLTSIGYTSANTASNLVQRDASGNFSAGIISVIGQTYAGYTSGSTTGIVNFSTATNGLAYLTVGNLGRVIGTEATTGDFIFNRNITYDGTTYRYLNTGGGSQISMTTGTLTFKTAVSGTGGNTATLNTIVTVGTDTTLNSGDLIVNTAGKTIKIRQGANACAGTGVTLSGGTATVLTSAVATGDIILLTCTAAGGTQGIVRYSISNGASFTITSSSATDTSTYSWVIIKAA